MKFTQTIGFRLFLLIASVQMVILFALTYATVTVQRSNLMENVILSAGRISDLIRRSTQYSMLLNRKEDVHEIISSQGGEPGIEGIRIYNKQGVVIFGTVASELNSRVDMDAEACVSCHTTNGLERPAPPTEKLYRIITRANGERVLGLITPIRNLPECADAACHAHPATKTVLGVIDVKMSLAQVDQQLAETEVQLLKLSVAAVLLISLVSGGFIWLFVRRPVKRLMNGMEMVSSGRLDLRMEATSRDELGQLARTFNGMTADLERAQQELTAWSATLEQKVKEKTADLERAHKQMVRVEKMASLGNLASSVAHELNNPLEGILTFAKLVAKRIRKSALSPEEIRRNTDDLDLVAGEAQRCGNIVKNLLVFARQKGMTFQTVKLKTILDRCVMLVNHHAQIHNVELRATCTDNDGIECDPDQIQQVLIALMMNAIEAMSGTSGGQGGGTLTVDVKQSAAGNALVLRVADTGVGMSDEVKSHIFEPFFTTKSEGKGVGLGLAIAYGIIERHHGAIDVDTGPARGTVFTVTLPTHHAEAPGAPGVQSPLEGIRHE